MKISVTRALASLKKYDAEIVRKCNVLNVMSATIKGVIPNVSITPAAFAVNAQAQIDSLLDTIKARDVIKRGIVISNANTKITFPNNQEMLVADAIERKSSIQYTIDLITALRKQAQGVINLVDTSNEKVNQRLDAFIEASFGRGAKVSPDDYNNAAKPFLAQHSVSLLDPIDIHKLIEKLEVEVTDFTSEVDFLLSESNSITTIEV